MNLKDNKIKHEGAKYLADILHHKNNIVELNLEDNEIGEKGAEHLAKCLCENTVSFINYPYFSYKNALFFIYKDAYHSKSWKY